MNDEEIKIRWSEIDPFGTRIVLNRSTYEKHIVGESHLKDIIIRKSLEPYARIILRDPKYIVRDNTGCQPRNLYYDIANVTGKDLGSPNKLRMAKIVVDIDREPNEVVSWMPVKDAPLGEGRKIIYERGDVISNK